MWQARKGESYDGSTGKLEVYSMSQLNSLTNNFEQSVQAESDWALRPTLYGIENANVSKL